MSLTMLATATAKTMLILRTRFTISIHVIIANTDAKCTQYFTHNGTEQLK